MKRSHFTTPRQMSECQFTSGTGTDAAPRQLSDACFDVGEAQALASRFTGLQAERVRITSHATDYIIAALGILFLALVAADVIPIFGT